MSVSITTADFATQTDTARRVLPLSVAALAAATIASSSVVLFEPAVCDLLFLLLLGVMLLTGRLTLKRHVHPLLHASMYVIVLTNLISLPFSSDLAKATFYGGVTIYLVVSWFCFVSLAGRYGEKFAQLCFNAFTVAALITSIIGFLARFSLVPNAELFMLDSSMTRIRGTFKDANVFAPFVVAAAMIMVGEVARKGRITLLQIACLALYAVCILFAFSRGAFIHLFISFVSLLALHAWIVNFRGKIVPVLFALVPMGMLAILGGAILLQTTELGDFFGQRMSLQSYDSERFGTHRQIMATVAQSPLGIGPGQWLVRSTHDVHSLYLRMWVENGLLGIMALAVFLTVWLLVTFRQILRRGPLTYYYITCFAIVVGILVESLVIDTVHWRHFFLFLALPIGLAAYERSCAYLPSDSDDGPASSFGGNEPQTLIG